MTTQTIKPTKKRIARGYVAPKRKRAVAKTKANDVAQPTIVVRKQAKPLAAFAGMWANDDTFDEFVAAMKEYRNQTA